MLLILLVVVLILGYVAIAAIHLALGRNNVLLLRRTRRTSVRGIGELELRGCGDWATVITRIAVIVSGVSKVKG